MNEAKATVPYVKCPGCGGRLYIYEKAVHCYDCATHEDIKDAQGADDTSTGS